jgi:hypothetical protein
VKPAAILAVFDKWRFNIATNFAIFRQERAKAIRQSHPYDTAQELYTRETGRLVRKMKTANHL